MLAESSDFVANLASCAVIHMLNYIILERCCSKMAGHNVVFQRTYWMKPAAAAAAAAAVASAAEAGAAAAAASSSPLPQHWKQQST